MVTAISDFVFVHLARCSTPRGIQRVGSSQKSAQKDMCLPACLEELAQRAGETVSRRRFSKRQ